MKIGLKIHSFLYRMTMVSKIFWFYPSCSGEESICIFWTLFQHSKLKTIENFCKPNGKVPGRLVYVQRSWFFDLIRWIKTGSIR